LTTPRVWVPRHVARLVIDYFDYAMHPSALARRAARHPALRRLLQLCRASRYLAMSRGSSRGSSRRSSLTTPPTQCVRVPRHVAHLVIRLVIDYFTYAARPVASIRRAACRMTHRRLLRLAQARRRLLCLCRAFGCLGTSRGSSPGSSSTTSTTPRVQVHRHVARLVTRLVTLLVIDYSAYAARPGASTRRAARHLAHHQLLHLCRASGCFDTSRKLVIDYLAYAVRPGASARCAARHAARCRLLRLRRASGCLSTSRGFRRILLSVRNMVPTLTSRWRLGLSLNGRC
jgi:hypothetical protein